MMSNYTVELADAGRDRDTVLSIWHGNLGLDEAMPAKYDWFYRACPDGEPLLLKLVHTDSATAVGTLAAGRRRMLWSGQPVVAGLLVDLTVDPAHRTLGPALKLQRDMKSLAAPSMPLLYLFPNAASAPVYQRAGYQQIGRIIRHARILRHGGYLAKHLPRPLAALVGTCLDFVDRLRMRSKPDARRTRWSDTVVDEMDGLWTRSPHGERLLAIRDTTYLRWRFDACPLGGTRFLLLHDAEGRLDAWFACHVNPANCLVVQDFWSIDAATGIAADRVAPLVAAARAAGHDAVWFEFAGPDALMAGWKACGFIARTSRPVFGIVPGAAKGDLTPRLHLTTADEDQ